MAVTTVDSGSKALEFLGLRENDESKPSTPSVSPNNHQVWLFTFSFFVLKFNQFFFVGVSYF